MKVERRSLLGGAADASGIAVIIDVLRAFTCSALMFRYGIRDLALVRTPEEALAFRDADSDYLVAGEVKGRKVDGFDVGNSPADIVAKGETFFSGRPVAARSSAGTQGVLAAASRARQVILGSYLTAAATAAYIRDAARVDALVHGEDVIVTLVAMGFEGVRPSKKMSDAPTTSNTFSSERLTTIYGRYAIACATRKSRRVFAANTTIARAKTSFSRCSVTSSIT
jgi:2-phosphosulfolactate phosphatase